MTFHKVPQLSTRFHHFPSLSMVMFWNILGFSRRFHHVPSCSIMFHHVPWGSIMFHHLLSCSRVFHHLLSCSMSFHDVLIGFCGSLRPSMVSYGVLLGSLEKITYVRRWYRGLVWVYGWLGRNEWVVLGTQDFGW
jgi:hypothetical protein